MVVKWATMKSAAGLLGAVCTLLGGSDAYAAISVAPLTPTTFAVTPPVITA